jgi:hypothetical protein
LAVTAEVYRAAGAIMAERGLLQGVADEGGWWPAFSSNEEGLETLVRSIERAGFIPGEDVSLSLDVAASEFGHDGRYRLGLEQRELDRDALAEVLLGWCARYPILSIEDPFAEDDDKGFERFTAAVGERMKRKPLAMKDAAPASGQSSQRARARPRIRRSFIWRLAGAPDSSRSARSRALNGWRNGTRLCASRKLSARRRASPASMKCRCDAGRRNQSKQALDGGCDHAKAVHRERRARGSRA